MLKARNLYSKRKRCFIICFTCLVISLVLVVSCSAEYKSGSVFNIRDYGAKPDGETLCTKAIQKAIDECAAAGGGRVLIPSGRFLSGTIIMKSGVELHLAHNAVLLGSTSRNDYPPMPNPNIVPIRTSWVSMRLSMRLVLKI